MKIENRIVEVSQNGKKWLKRVLLFKKGDRYLTWGDATTFEEAEKSTNVCSWIYMREISEPKYVPFTWKDRDLVRGKWFRAKSNPDIEYCVTRVDFGLDNELFIEGVGFDMDTDTFLEDYEFLDGTPCGKLVE